MLHSITQLAVRSAILHGFNGLQYGLQSIHSLSTFSVRVDAADEVEDAKVANMCMSCVCVFRSLICACGSSFHFTLCVSPPPQAESELFHCLLLPPLEE